MGRKPIEKDNVKVKIYVGIKRKYAEELKKNNINISKVIDEFLDKNIQDIIKSEKYKKL